MGLELPLALALLPWLLPLLALLLPMDKLLRLGSCLLKYKYVLLISYVTVSAMVLTSASFFGKTQETLDAWIVPMRNFRVKADHNKAPPQQQELLLPLQPKPAVEPSTRNTLSSEHQQRSQEELRAFLHQLRDGSVHMEEMEVMAQLPPTLTDQVKVSLLFEYWGGTGRSARHARRFVKALEKMKKCMKGIRLKFEVLINVDSPFIRNGDVAMLNRVLGRQDYVLLSNNLGETRAYNNLARLSRGEYLLLLQDDTPLPAACNWTVDLVKMMDAQKETVGMIGVDTGILHVSRHDYLYEKGLLEMDPRCYDFQNRRFVEAVPCAAMGPLIIRRSLFQYLGGFNETLSKRGKPSSLLDCELSARIWLAGYVVKVVNLHFFEGTSSNDNPQSHVAWKAFDGYGMVPDEQMNVSDRRRRTIYSNMFNTPEATYAIMHAAKLYNGEFPSSSAVLLRT